MPRYTQYCKEPEKIENYERAKADNFVGWECHHRLETHNSDGERRLVNISTAELLALGMYYNRPAEELIFLTSSEHHSLHNKGETHPLYGKHHSEQSRHKMSEAKKNMSEETRKKMSEAHKGKSTWNKGKYLSEEHKKKLSETLKGKLAGENNPMYGKKHSEETKNKIGEAHKGKHWYNNGKINIRAKECPPGFIPGRLRK